MLATANTLSLGFMAHADRALEESIQQQRNAFGDVRRTLEQAVAPHFADAADAADALITTAEIYGPEAAATKLGRSLRILSEPASEAKPADPGLCQRAQGLLDELLEHHDKIDRLNSEYNKNPSREGPERIFIQGEPYAVLADGQLAPIPEPAREAAKINQAQSTASKASAPQKPEPPPPHAAKGKDQNDTDEDAPEPDV